MRKSNNHSTTGKDKKRKKLGFMSRRNRVKTEVANRQDNQNDQDTHATVIKPLRQVDKKSEPANSSGSKLNSKTSSAKTSGAKKATSSAKDKNIKVSGEKASGIKDRNTKKPSFLGQAKNKKQPTVYTSVKNRNKPVFSGGSGASSRADASYDRIRFQTVWAVTLALFVILVARASYVQLIDPHYYASQGQNSITTTQTQKAYRGIITDRHGQPLAISAPLSTVSFSPFDYAHKYYATKRELELETKRGNKKKVKKWQAQLKGMDLQLLANASGISLAALEKSVNIDEDLDVMSKGYQKRIKQVLPSGRGSHYFPIFKNVIPEVADVVTKLNFAGVTETLEFRRYYPQPQPNAQLLGFMSHNSKDPDEGYKGRAGIERQYEERLAGKDGKLLMLKDLSNNELRQIKELEPTLAGEDLTLTIDARLQYLLYTELEKVGRVQQARWATGMVVDVHTGEVLAMSTWPSYNTNNMSEANGNNQRNRTVIDAFEPGSVMKPFTVAVALSSNQYNLNSLIDTSPGVIRVNGYNIRDHGNLGIISLATLLKKSSNVASTKIALSLPADAIANMQRQFGFGTPTALNFNAEKAGNIPTPTDKQLARRATMSYGYGVEVTLAQLAQAYATLGADGLMHPLTLLKSDDALPAKRVIPKEHANAIVQMMQTVTETGGTGTKAAIDGYSVAGKTGTARRVNPDGGYYDDQYRTVFAGVAPASNPRLATVILVEDPQENHYAGDVAAPVFKQVMEDALRLYNVPLDKPLPTRTSTAPSTTSSQESMSSQESILQQTIAQTAIFESSADEAMP